MFDMKIKNPMGTLQSSMGSLQDATETLASMGMEKTQEILLQINLLLKLLQSAGYCVGSLDIELSLPPKITIKLKTSAAVQDEKLIALMHEHGDKKVVAGIIAALVQANKLRGTITLETLELDEAQIILTATPNITMRWKDKGDGAA